MTMNEWKKIDAQKPVNFLEEIAAILNEAAKIYVELESRRIKAMAEAIKTINESKNG